MRISGSNQSRKDAVGGSYQPRTAVLPEQIMVAMLSLLSRQSSTAKRARCMPQRFGTISAALLLAREDVGRHNALDKLSGALARASVVASEGIILPLPAGCRSRWCRKSAAIGASVMVSAPWRRRRWLFEWLMPSHYACGDCTW